MSMNDVYPVLAKRWYGYGDKDFYWELFSVHGTLEGAQQTVDRMNSTQRRPRSRSNPYEEGRKKEFMYQRNMVI